MASTAQEALIAELLGDVGKLHDAIKGLPKALAPVCGAVVKVTKDAQATIEVCGAAQESRVRAAAHQERESLRADVKKMISSMATRQAAAGGFVGLWKVTALVGIVAAACSFLGYRAASVPDERLLSYAAYGRAVSAAWDQLDDKAQAEIRKNIAEEN